MLPNLAPSVFAAWIFAFIGSFDEVIVTSFIAGKYETVPKKMFNELILEVNPTITAVATLLTRSCGRVAGPAAESRREKRETDQNSAEAIEKRAEEAHELTPRHDTTMIGAPHIVVAEDPAPNDKNMSSTSPWTSVTSPPKHPSLMLEVWRYFFGGNDKSSEARATR